MRINATGIGLPDATRSTSIGRLAYLRQSYATRARRLQTSCLDHGGRKPTPTMLPLSLDGLAGVNKGVGIPLLDL